MVGWHAQRVNGVTVCTGGSERWRGSLIDCILIAENACAALFVSTRVTGLETTPKVPASCRQLQNIRLSADVQKRDPRCSVGARCRRATFYPPGFAKSHARTFIAAEHPSHLRRG